MKGNEKVTDLVTFSVYDTKPVHFLSTAAGIFEVGNEEEKVWVLEFFQTELQKNYNHRMNDMNISDQFRKVY